MEEDNGRARVFSQTGDSQRVVEEAVRVAVQWQLYVGELFVPLVDPV